MMLTRNKNTKEEPRKVDDEETLEGQRLESIIVRIVDFTVNSVPGAQQKRRKA